MSEKTIKLSAEEMEILKTYEDGEWGSIEEIESEKQRSQPKCSSRSRCCDLRNMHAPPSGRISA